MASSPIDASALLAPPGISTESDMDDQVSQVLSEVVPENAEDAGFTPDQALWLSTRLGRVSGMVTELMGSTHQMQTQMEEAETLKANLLHDHQDLRREVERMHMAEADAEAELGTQKRKFESLIDRMDSVERSARNSDQKGDTHLLHPNT